MNIPQWLRVTLRWVGFVALIMVAWDMSVHGFEFLLGDEMTADHDHAHHGEWLHSVLALGLVGLSVYLWNYPLHRYCGCNVFDIHSHTKFANIKFLLISLLGFGMHQLIEGFAIGVSTSVGQADNILVWIGFVTHGVFDLLVAWMFYHSFPKHWQGGLALVGLVGARMLGSSLSGTVDILAFGWALGLILILSVFFMGMFLHLPVKLTKQKQTACCGGHHSKQ